MIVAKAIDYVGITGAAHKMTTSAHAAYWLNSHGEECESAQGMQERAIMEGFREIAALLGYELVKSQQKQVRPQVDDEAEILQRLVGGDTIVFSMDGDMAWFTKGDRAFVGDAIMSLREKGYLLRKHDVVDDEDDPRGIAYYDTISDAGRAHLAADVPMFKPRPGLSDAGVPTHG